MRATGDGDGGADVELGRVSGSEPERLPEPSGDEFPQPDEADPEEETEEQRLRTLTYGSDWQWDRTPSACIAGYERYSEAERDEDFITYLTHIKGTARLLGREFAQLRAKYGTGVALYFAQLRLTVALLVLMTALAGVSMHYEFASKPTRYFGWFRVSVGNLQPYPAKLSSWSLAAPDVVYCLLFFVGLGLVSRRLRRLRQRVTKDAVTIATFTVWVRGLPERGLQVSEVQAFFAEYGNVINVVVPVNAMAVHRANEAVAKAKRELRRQLAFEDLGPGLRWYRRLWLRPSAALAWVRYEPLRRLVARDSVYWQTRVAAAERQRERARAREYGATGTCFVTFETEDAARACVQRLRLGWWGEVWRRALRATPLRCVADWAGPPAFAGTHTLRVQPAPEPDNVMWPNLAYGRRVRVARSFVTLLLSAAVSVLGMVAVVLLEGYSEGRGGFAFTEVDVDLEKDEGGRGINPTSLLGASSIFVVDHALSAALLACSSWEKHLTVSGHRSSYLQKTTLARYLSLVMITLVIYHPWTTEQWVANGGAEAVLYILTVNQIVVPVGWSLAAPVVRRAARMVSESRALTPEDAAREPPRATLEVAERYSVMLTALGMSLLYSSALPLALPLCAVAVATQYALDMHNLLHVYKAPPRIDGKLAKQALAIAPHFVWLHVVLGILAYQRSFRTDTTDHMWSDLDDCLWSGDCYDYGPDGNGPDGGSKAWAPGWVMLIFLGLLVATYYVLAVIRPLLIFRCRCKCSCLCRRRRGAGAAGERRATPEGSTVFDFPSVLGETYSPLVHVDEVCIMSNATDPRYEAIAAVTAEAGDRAMAAALVASDRAVAAAMVAGDRAKEAALVAGDRAKEAMSRFAKSSVVADASAKMAAVRSKFSSGASSHSRDG